MKSSHHIWQWLGCFWLSCWLLQPAAAVWSHKKRREEQPGPSSSSSFAAERELGTRSVLNCDDQTWTECAANSILRLWIPKQVYHMDSQVERNQLIDDLWIGQLRGVAGRISRENPQLLQLFNSLRTGNADEPPRFRLKTSVSPRFEGVLISLLRARSQKLMPIEVVALSVVFLHYGVSIFPWNAVAAFSRSVCSWSWTVQLCEDALLRDPGAPYPTARGMTAAVFDNFMIKVGYGSYATVESSARKFEMTNWATAFLPSQAVPPNFSIDTILSNGGLFRSDIRLSDFLDLFSPISVDIMANKRRRWIECLNAAAVGTLWDKVDYDSPYPPTEYHYHEPIFDRLQSSYEDVNFELDVMRNSIFHRYADCIQIGGDGLSYMRLIHRLAQDPQRFLESKPVIIPRLGEAPHGKYHILHGDWRIWAPLILRIAEVANNKFVKADPIISEFNEHEHFLRIMVEAFSEYVLEIANTGSDYQQVDHFLQMAERNLSFAYICYFLFIFGFKYVQFRTAVRRNDSHLLDKIWRENLASARTKSANKTQYSQMTVALIYWGCALVQPLHISYHRTRTLKWVKTHVGWDFCIEMLNKWIKESVTAHVTEDLIKKFIRRVNFTHKVKYAYEEVLFANRQDEAESLKFIGNDKELIKEFLRTTIGRDFDTATTPSDDNQMNLDLKDWGGNRRNSRPREHTPWKKMEDIMADYRDYVRRHVAKLCPWHHWL